MHADRSARETGPAATAAEHPDLVRLGPSAATPFQPALHRHDYSTLLLVTGGTGVHRVDGVDEDLRPPQVMLIGEGQAHGWRVPEAPTGAAIRFTGRLLDQHLRLPERMRAGTWLGLGSVRPSPERWARTRTILRLLGAADPALGESRVASLLLGALLLELFAAGSGEPGWDAPPGPPAAASSLGSTGAGAVQRFRVAARVRPHAARGIAWHSRELGVSERALTRLVREHTGQPPGELLRAALADEAGRLLRTTELPVQTIARRLGFLDPSYFSRFVRRELGSAPQEYRGTPEPG